MLLALWVYGLAVALSAATAGKRTDDDELAQHLTAIRSQIENVATPTWPSRGSGAGSWPTRWIGPPRPRRTPRSGEGAGTRLSSSVDRFLKQCPDRPRERHLVRFRAGGLPLGNGPELERKLAYWLRTIASLASGRGDPGRGHRALPVDRASPKAATSPSPKTFASAWPRPWPTGPSSSRPARPGRPSREARGTWPPGQNRRRSRPWGDTGICLKADLLRCVGQAGPGRARARRRRRGQASPARARGPRGPRAAVDRQKSSSPRRRRRSMRRTSKQPEQGTLEGQGPPGRACHAGRGPGAR